MLRMQDSKCTLDVPSSRTTCKINQKLSKSQDQLLDSFEQDFQFRHTWRNPSLSNKSLCVPKHRSVTRIGSQPTTSMATAASARTMSMSSDSGSEGEGMGLVELRSKGERRCCVVSGSEKCF